MKPKKAAPSSSRRRHSPFAGSAARNAGRGQAVLLVGHGATASDCPRELVAEYKGLEGRRQAAGGPVTSRESELERTIRHWPRTTRTDPYQAGVEAIVRALRRRLKGRLVEAAYNEFCAPTIEEAVERLAREGATAITVIPTMYTRGGVHSEREIPAILKDLRRRYPALTLGYAWPFRLEAVADFLSAHVARS